MQRPRTKETYQEATINAVALKDHGAALKDRGAVAGATWRARPTNVSQLILSHLFNFLRSSVVVESGLDWVSCNCLQWQV
jgi:hypothetical protein